MTTKTQVFTAILSAALFCGVALAQEPTVNIDSKRHPNLAEAQRLLVEANHKITQAQTDNKRDMKGHAEKARQLILQADKELTAAAEAANAAGERSKDKDKDDMKKKGKQ